MSIEAMKQALVALEQIKQKTFHPAKVFAYNPAIITLRQAIAEAEKQEPVAWMMVNKTHGHFPSLHWEPQKDWHITWDAIPLYTAPPARKPLTEPELNAIEPTWPATWNYDDVLAFVRAIERAHGIGG